MFNLGRKQDGVGSGEKSERKSVFPQPFSLFRALHYLVPHFLCLTTAFYANFTRCLVGKSGIMIWERSTVFLDCRSVCRPM